MSTARRRPARLALACTLAAIAAGGPMTACRGDRSDKPPRQFFPDMDDQPRLNPQSETQFFSDNRSMRTPPEGTVAFGYAASIVDAEWNAQNNERREALLKTQTDLYFGTDGSGNPIERIPIEVTSDVLERGAERFGIYCAVCHGYQGEGANAAGGGMAGRKWAAPVPSLLGELYLPDGDKGADGYLFGVIRNGVWGPDGANRMPGYAHAVSERDAWAIVAHLRVLQRHAGGSIDDLDESTRMQLMSERTVAPAAEAPSDAPAEGETESTGGTP